MISRSRLAAAGVLAMAAATTLVAQQQPPRFRSGVRVIEVDARVVDSNDRPVRGMTAGDFIVTENGAERSIVAFSEIVLPSSTSAGSAADGGLNIVDVADNQAPEGRLLVMLIDDGMLPPDMSMVKATKDVARRAIELMGPADRMAVVFTNNNRHAQDFTSDRSRLLKAIETTSVGFSFSSNGDAKLAVAEKRMHIASLETLKNVADALGDIPAARKAILYVGIGAPLGGTEDETRELARHWRSVLQMGLGSSLPIYALDPGGLGGLEAFIAVDPLKRAVSGQPWAFREFLQTVAAITGGRATLNTNDLNPGVERAFEDTASYYLIGFETPLVEDDGKFRRLEVRTRRPGTRVIARSSYFARPAKRDSRSAAVKAIGGALPRTELRMRATAVPLALASGQPTVAVTIGFDHPFEGPGPAHNLSLVTAVVEHRGQQRRVQNQTARVPRPAATQGEPYEIPIAVDLSPGRYRLRIGAENKQIARSGSVFVDVDVPDFRNDRLSMSGLMLHASSAPRTAIKSPIASLLPAVPTALRDFTREDRVGVFAKLFHGIRHRPGDVAVACTLTNARGDVLDTRTQVVAASAFRTRAANVSWMLPLTSLAAGSYRLDVTATTDGAAPIRRATVFRVH